MKNSHESRSVFITRSREPGLFADLERLATRLEEITGVSVTMLGLAREALKLGVVALLVKNGLHSVKRGRPSRDRARVRTAAKEAAEEMTLMELEPMKKVDNG